MSLSVHMAVGGYRPPTQAEILKAVKVTDEMVERAILAASQGVDGCHVEGVGGCGGTHTECYYRGILEAALTPSDEKNETEAQG